MKIKIFENITSEALEAQVNEFLETINEKETNIVDVQYQLRPLPTLGGGSPSFIHAAIVITEPLKVEFVDVTPKDLGAGGGT